MNIENLREQDVTELQNKLADMVKDNPYIKSTVYPMAENSGAVNTAALEHSNLLRETIEKLDALDRKIDHIFKGNGEDIIINGNFTKIKL